jgi:hypothetical protein
MFNVGILARLILAAVFSMSALGKWLNREWFVEVVRQYRLVPNIAVRPIATSIAMCESVLAGLLATGALSPWSGIAAAALLGVFTLALCINLARGNTQMGCGCSGVPRTTVISWHGAVQNCGLIGLALLSSLDAGFTEPLLGVFVGSLALVLTPAIVVRLIPRVAVSVG